MDGGLQGNVPALQGVGAVEMNAGDLPVIGVSAKYEGPGIYTVEVCRKKYLPSVLEDALNVCMVYLAILCMQTPAEY